MNISLTERLLRVERTVWTEATPPAQLVPLGKSRSDLVGVEALDASPATGRRFIHGLTLRSNNEIECWSLITRKTTQQPRRPYAKHVWGRRKRAGQHRIYNCSRQSESFSNR